MNSKRLILPLAVVSVLFAAGIAWTELTHRPRTLDIAVEGMACESCASTVRESLEKLPGVSDVAISVEKGEAQLTLDGWSETTPAEVNAAIKAAGYKVRE
ncbi:MAG: heavy metal-associated domain-containing protein [Pirellulales bacterium]